MAKATQAQRDAAIRQERAQEAALLFKQVSVSTRLQIVLMLAEGERHPGAICQGLNLSRPATSHHLEILRHGGIVYPYWRGRTKWYALTARGERLASIVKGALG